MPLLINDRVDVALAAGADGVHLGQSDLPAAAARRLLGPHLLLGVSAKTPGQALRALADGADYVGAGAGKCEKASEVCGVCVTSVVVETSQPLFICVFLSVPSSWSGVAILLNCDCLRHAVLGFNSLPFLSVFDKHQGDWSHRHSRTG